MAFTTLFRPVACLAVFLITVTAAGRAQSGRVGHLTLREQEVPRRLVGYGLVVGLEGTGDATFSAFDGATYTVQTVTNLLKRFGIEVPTDRMRLRNVAAVLVTAELSPYLRAGGRFDVQVSSLGDATSLRGGVLWMTPLVEDVGEPPIATAQGPLLLSGVSDDVYSWRGGTAGRIPDGGVLEVERAALPSLDSLRLLLRRPDLGTATRIAAVVNGSFGAGTAEVADPGTVKLTPPAADNIYGFLAAIDTLPISQSSAPRLVVDAQTGTVVAGGGLTVGAAVVSHRGVTLSISDGQAAPASAPGVITADEGATVQEIAAGLHAIGAAPREIAAIFEALRDIGALTAGVVIR